ncbi:MAG: DsrE family protein [Nitrososphaerota archaeon]
MKVGLIINSPSYDRVSYGLTIAGMYAALGKEVHVIFTYGAIERLIKGRTDLLGDETDAWIRETVRAGLKKGSVERLSDRLKSLKKLGGRLYACISAMATHSITKDDLIDEVDKVMGIAAFLELVGDSPILLYV